MLFGVAVGGALVYFLDPQHGARRREQVRDWWDQNREPVMNSATSAASTVQAKATETSAKVGERVNQAGEKVNEKVSELSSRVRREANRVSVE
jgi:gas vesicle protein